MTSAPFIPAGIAPNNGNATREWNASDLEALNSPGEHPYPMVLFLMYDRSRDDY